MFAFQVSRSSACIALVAGMLDTCGRMRVTSKIERIMSRRCFWMGFFEHLQVGGRICGAQDIIAG